MKILMIVGMHRSGTSLTTQWLHRCGLKVGNDLLGASIGNSEGHFEDEDFYNLHCAWLVKRKLTHTGFISQSPGSLDEKEKQQLKTLLAEKNKSNEQWGWKEPRTCLWLTEYRELLPDSFNLIVVRNFNDTVNSMVMREYRRQRVYYLKKVETKRGLSKLKWKYLKEKKPSYYFKLYAEDYLKIWIHYYEAIIRYCHSLPVEKYFLVRYEDLLQNDNQVFDHLVNQWGFSLHFVPFKTVFKKELLSNTKNISHFVKDKELIKKAAQLEAECSELSKTQSL